MLLRALESGRFLPVGADTEVESDFQLIAGSNRDLNASITRMATLAPGGRIDEATVEDEIARLQLAWQGREEEGDKEKFLRELLGEKAFAELDRFDRVQLADVVHVCRECRTLSEAGKRLFAVSREQKASNNDADRPSKYLARFGLRFTDIKTLKL